MNWCHDLFNLKIIIIIEMLPRIIQYAWIQYCMTCVNNSIAFFSLISQTMYSTGVIKVYKETKNINKLFHKIFFWIKKSVWYLFNCKSICDVKKGYKYTKKERKFRKKEQDNLLCIVKIQHLTGIKPSRQYHQSEIYAKFKSSYRHRIFNYQNNIQVFGGQDSTYSMQLLLNT